MRLLENDVYDYKTAPVVGDQVVDLHRTGTSYYDDFLSGSDQTKNYLRTEKNLVGEVVMMSPEEYYRECAEYAFPNRNVSVESLKAGRRRDSETLKHLKNVLTVHKRRFPMPYINKADPGQEGLHRMMVIGDLFDWNHKVPVLIIDWADKQRAFESQKQKRIQRIEYNIKRAVQNALMYKFKNIEELREQIQWELDKQFDYNDDDIDTPVQFELTSDEKEHSFIVSIGAASYDFDYDTVNFVDFEPDMDDLDIDDLDLETSEDFLVRYFGDNWRETHPHLKDVFNITEALQGDLDGIQKTLDEFDYAFIDKDGNELDSEDAMNAAVQSPEQLSKLRKGVCTDYVEYTKKFLDDRGINYTTYDISFTDEDGDEPAHVCIVAHIDGKYVWIENSWHSEKGNHEYSNLNDFFEDIAKKHCVWDGNDYLDSCVIREFDKSLVGMTQQQVYDYMHTLKPVWTAKNIIKESFDTDNIKQIDKIIQHHWASETPGEGCIFISPNGKFINIYPKLDDHEDLCYWLEEQGFGDTPGDAEWFVTEFGYVRCRNSTHLCFIEVPQKMTREQYHSLEQWLEEKVSSDTIDIEAWSGEWKTYNLAEYFPEEIIKIIKRSYSSGKLYEKLK